MKKLIAMLLLLAMVTVAVTSCGTAPVEPTPEGDKLNSGSINGEDGSTSSGVTDMDASSDPLAYMAKIYAASKPTKTVATWTQKVGARGEKSPMNGSSVLTVGKVSGKDAAVYTETYDKIADVGGNALVETVSSTKTYYDGRIRTNNGPWRKGYNFAPYDGSIAPVLNDELVDTYSYENHVLTLSVSSENADAFFANFMDFRFKPTNLNIKYDIQMTIEDVGGTISRVTLKYTIPAGETVTEPIQYEATLVYSYDLQQISIQ